VANEDEITTAIQQLSDGWARCFSWTDQEMANQMRTDKIDILIDLAGHTGGNRLLTFARRAAPVQITYLGYCNTTGMSMMDYRITDAIADPIDTQQPYTERLLRLPNGFSCYAPPRDAPAVSA